ncbi:MAG TPA: type II secretion system protein [Candidatus Omnitrophota bacterium]|nr:type II secretion system protein [Candidatus Omnitrophota bacterium]HRZ15590.1 type II secretion system protein [Candidatus Omnitrophota bacterium]
MNKRARKKKGVTLVEMMMVVLLFTGILSAMLFILMHSDTYWTRGQAKIDYQAKARVAIIDLAKQMRQSKASWVRISNTDLGNSSDYTLFYRPLFDADGNYTGTSWVVYRFDEVNNQLLKREQGELVYSTLIDNVENAQWFASSDCATFGSTTVSTTCPRVRFALVVRTNDDEVEFQEYNVTTDIELRNEFTSGTAEPEWPEEGEF